MDSLQSQGSNEGSNLRLARNASGRGNIGEQTWFFTSSIINPSRYGHVHRIRYIRLLAIPQLNKGSGGGCANTIIDSGALRQNHAGYIPGAVALQSTRPTGSGALPRKSSGYRNRGSAPVSLSQGYTPQKKLPSGGKSPAPDAGDAWAVRESATLPCIFGDTTPADEVCQRIGLRGRADIPLKIAHSRGSTDWCRPGRICFLMDRPPRDAAPCGTGPRPSPRRPAPLDALRRRSPPSGRRGRGASPGSPLLRGADVNPSGPAPWFPRYRPADAACSSHTRRNTATGTGRRSRPRRMSLARLPAGLQRQKLHSANESWR